MRICTICARGGSKGLPSKNTKFLLGEPLISWSISQAKQTGLFDYIAVSSDSKEIIGTGWTAGANFFIDRPKELATDEIGKIPVIVHAVESVEREINLKFDTIVDLDVTSPLRIPEDIIEAVRMQEDSKCSNVITGTPAHRSPAFNMVQVRNNVAELVIQSSVVRRQDSPEYFDLNASIYVWNRDKFMDDPKLFYTDTKLYIMPPERSVDVDSQLDFDIVEMILKKRMLN